MGSWIRKIFIIMKLLLYASVLTSFVHCLPTTEDNELTEDLELQTCSEIFENQGMNYSSFSVGAGHGVHSLSLEELRYFFKEDAPEHNKIPTVNFDFRSEDIIHFNAPLRGYSNRFDTWALKIMDWFMLNDAPYLYQNKANTLEKISHQYHMHEIYTRAAKIYKSLEENPPSNIENVCKCAGDLTGNGIMDEVVMIARKLKYFGNERRGRQRDFRYRNRPQLRPSSQWYRDLSRLEASSLRYRNPSRPRPTGGCEGVNIYNTYNTYGRRPCVQFKRSAEETEVDVEQVKQNYLENSNKDTAEAVVMSDDAWTANTLLGPEYVKWTSYSAMLTYSLPDDDQIRDFAYFIYCMLNHTSS